MWRIPTLPACLMLLPLPGCGPEPPSPPPTAAAAPAWSDQQEVIHQLREVIRYEDENERVRREALRELALDVDPAAVPEPGVAAGKGQDQSQQ